MSYRSPTEKVYAKRVAAIGPAFKEGIAQLHELEDMKSDDIGIQSFLVKVFECGQATYRLPNSRIIGKWDGKGYEFEQRMKGQKITSPDVT